MKNQNKDKGLGDTVNRISKRTKLDILAEKLAKAAGKEDCGCKKRQEFLNKKFPYK